MVHVLRWFVCLVVTTMRGPFLLLCQVGVQAPYGRYISSADEPEPMEPVRGRAPTGLTTLSLESALQHKLMSSMARLKRSRLVAGTQAGFRS